MTTATTEQVTNGVNVTALRQTIEAIKEQPGLGKGRFRAVNQWVDGAHNRAQIKGFYVAGKEDDDRTTAHTHDLDEPPVLLGNDVGANPVEYALSALSGCLTTSLIYHAAARGIRINRVESQLEGELDLNGFLGLDPAVRNGFANIRVTFKVDADAPRQQVEELVEIAQQRSPVFDIVSNPVPVTVQLADED